MEVETRPPVTSSAPFPKRSLPSPQRPEWRSADILRGAALVLGVWFTLKLLWIAYPLLFVAFLGLLFGLAVASGADRLERLRIPRGLGSLLVVLSFVGLLVGLGFWVGPALREQLSELRTAVPQAIDKVEGWVGRQQNGFIGQMLPMGTGTAPAAAAPAGGAGVQAEGQAGRQAQGPRAQGAGAAGAQRPSAGSAPGEESNPGNQPLGELKNLPEGLSGQLGSVMRYLFSFLSSTVAVVTGIFLILVLSIYIGAAPGLYKRGLLHLVPHHARPRADQVMSAVGMTLRRWLMAQLIAMAAIGVVTTLGLWALDIKAALALGLIAGLLEFIPLVGPLLSAIPAVAMGFLDSPQKALMVALLYIAIQQLENHILIPMVMKEGVDLPPVLTILGLALMGVVFGFLGMLVAVPLLAAVVVAIKLLYVEDVVGDDVKTVLDS